MDNKIVDTFLSKTLEYLNSTEAFLQKNVPAYVEELLQFSFYEAAFWAAFFPFVALVFVAFTVISIKMSKSENKSFSKTANNIGPICVAGSFMFIIISLFATPSWVSDAIKIKTAPRVYLVEKISSQMRAK